MSFSHSAVMRVSGILSLLSATALALWLIFPTYIAWFPVSSVVLALSSTSAFLSIYKYVIGYTPSELEHIADKFVNRMVIAARQDGTDLQHEEAVKRLAELKNRIDLTLKTLVSD